MKDQQDNATAANWWTSKRAFLRAVGAGTLTAGVVSAETAAGEHEEENGSDEIDTAEIDVTCYGGRGFLVASNTNDEAVQIDVDGPDQLDVFSGYSTAAPNGALKYSSLPDGDYLVRTLTDRGDAIGWEVVTVECGPRRVDASVECGGDGGTVAVENPNDDTVLVDVEGPDGADGGRGADAITKLYEVDSGEEREFEGLPDGDYLIRTLTEREDEIGWEVVTVGCGTKGGLRTLAVEVDCTSDGGKVTVGNPNDETVFADVDGPGDEDAIRGLTEVEPGARARVKGLSDGDYLIRTLTEDEDEVGTETVTVDC